MATVTDIIADARESLNDRDDGFGTPRYSNTVLLGYVNDGVAEMYGVRPDLQFGSYQSVPAALSLGSNIPFAGREQIALTYYVIARAEYREDQHVNSGRAQASMQMAKVLALGA